MATLPGGNASEVNGILDPFLQELKALNISVVGNEAIAKPTFSELFNSFVPPSLDNAFPSNNTLGGRLIPSSVVQNNLTELLGIYRRILDDGATNNLTYARIGIQPDANAALPAWRDSLFTWSASISFPENTSVDDLRFYQAKVNTWQDLLKPLTPGGGAYINEATFDDPDWKSDYFGENYDRLLLVKEKYDRNFTLWQQTSVGADLYWKEVDNGRLCRV